MHVGSDKSNFALGIDEGLSEAVKRPTQDFNLFEKGGSRKKVQLDMKCTSAIIFPVGGWTVDCGAVM